MSRPFTAFAILSALGAALFVFVLTRAPYDSFAAGTVVELVPRRPGADSLPPMAQFKDDYIVHIRFTSADGRDATVEHDRSAKAWREFKVGDSVNVNYNSADPRQFVLPVPGERASVMWPVAGAWLLVNGAFAIGLRVISKRRTGAEPS